jgi:thiopeptide-type bacteriocin biosynthesis protein
MEINKWFNSLYTDSLISKALNDTYIREAERYGGLGLILNAEDYFYRNSQLAMPLVSMRRFGKLNMNIDYIGVSFIVSALEAFGLSLDEMATLLNSMNDNKAHRKEYQDNRKIFMNAADSSDNWFGIRSTIQNPEVYDLLAADSLELKKYADAIYAADKQGELTNAIKEIALSVIHMFCNRLVGNNTWERKVYALARHSVHGLKGYLKHQKSATHDLLLNLQLPAKLF